MPRAQTDKFLAFDIGASGGRAITGALEDQIISLKEIRRFSNGMTRIHGRCHWDIYRLFEEIQCGLRDALKQDEIPLSVGIDTWGVDYGLLDEAGHILEIPYAYRDHRTDGIMDEVFRIIPKEDLYSLTGIQFLQFNTLFQLYAAQRDGLPAMKTARDLLFMPDLLNYFLTGVRFSEFTCATTSQLMNPKTGQWAPQVFQAIDVPIDIMQEIVHPGTILGGLTDDIAGESCLPDTGVVAVASHDTGSAIAAVPAEDDSFAYISSGTWSLMGIESESPVISPKSLELNFTNEGGVEGSWRILKNIMGLWLLQECRRSWADTGADFSIQALLSLAMSSKPFKSLIDPDHPSLLNPAIMQKALAGLAESVREPPMDNPGEFTRCILESLAFRYRQTLEELKQITDKKIRRIHIIGGGSQNHPLCQFTANATGLPVAAGPAEATALGNIMVQAMARGTIRSLAEARRILRNSFEFKEYMPENCSEWERQYSRFLDVCHRA
ncbi:MAG: rhamnulokinase [Acidobacteria bacterium]|nr:rhamnulokinase [Acidobacteriota bacterium]